MDVEWAKDGVDGQLYIVQARPETVASRRAPSFIEEYHLERTASPLTSPAARSATKIGGGTVRVVQRRRTICGIPARRGSGHRHHHARLGADHEDAPRPSSPIAAGAPATRRSSRASSAFRRSSAARNATERLATGETIDRLAAPRGCRQGLSRASSLRAPPRPTSANLPRPQTKIMLNVGNPELAFALSFLPNDGVGLARMEFIITDHIKAHPMALLHPERVDDDGARELALLDLRATMRRRREFFVAALWRKASPRSPRRSIRSRSSCACRTSRPTSTPSLLGGRAFEPSEANPMLGFRGAVALRASRLCGRLRARMRGDEARARDDGPATTSSS